MSIFRRKLMMAYAANKRSDDIIYPGLIAAWSAKGKTNDDADRATLRDLTGNGHDLTLNGFAFSGMSSYGGYSTNIVSYPGSYRDEYVTVSKTFDTININCVGNKELSNNFEWIIYFQRANKIFPKTVVDVNCSKDIALFYRHWDGEKLVETKLTNGLNTLPESKAKEGDGNWDGIYLKESIEGVNITIRELPSYPDALIFDGVNDYGINKNMPKITDYTIIIKREILKSKTQVTASYGTGSTASSGLSNFWLEYENTTTKDIRTFSLGNAINITDFKKPIITYQTSNNYNGLFIGGESKLQEQGTIFSLGCLSDSLAFCTNMVFYSAYIFDRNLDEIEIKSFIRKYIDPEYGKLISYPGLIAAWDIEKEGKNNNHPDREWARDLTGNGYDIQWKNVAFKEMSGYGGYMFTPTIANQYTQNGGVVDQTLNKIGILKILKTPTTENGQNYNVFQTPVEPEATLPAYKVKITGITNNGYYLKYSESSSLTFSSDGIYEIPIFTNKATGTQYPGLRLYKEEYTMQ